RLHRLPQQGRVRRCEADPVRRLRRDGQAAGDDEDRPDVQAREGPGRARHPAARMTPARMAGPKRVCSVRGSRSPTLLPGACARPGAA
ncbi:MAG: hypothetical protein ACK56F_27280, partial [bacterium]